MKNKFSWSRFKLSKTYIFIIGLSATLWFLFRVIPKPSRARYPCMQAAAPLMSSFVIYLLGVSATLFSFKKFKKSIQESRYLLGSLFLLISFASLTIIIANDSKETLANTFSVTDNSFPVTSNTPIGVAKGLHPGRVVWVHDDNATNEYYTPNEGSSDFWYSHNNADEDIIKEMLALSIKEYAGSETIANAWVAIFKSFNKTHGNSDKGYTAGEKISIKINLTNQCCTNEERMDGTPQLINALLHELTVNAGVAQKDITIGDPYRDFRPEYVNLVLDKYPDVNYVDGNGGNGVKKTVATTNDVLIFSDKNKKSTLPKHYLDAKYFINMPCLKTHDVGGITLIAKNHQGSYLKKGDDPAGQSAFAMHYSLVGENRGTGKYRHIIDYMGHKDTGGKALIYIIDGIWGGENWEGWIKKFKSAPFNDNYPNSIFVGQDPVAVESVCFDVLFQEYAEDNTKQNYPIKFKAEIADYLSQCASSDYWPTGIKYDPEGDGTFIGSLGVFEHWNNSTDRKYSRNLGTGEGIEIKYFKNGINSVSSNKIESINIAAPNPFSDYTKFKRPAEVSRNTKLEIYSMEGRLISSFDFGDSDIIVWTGFDAKNNMVPNGLYLYKINDIANKSVYSGKVVLRK